MVRATLGVIQRLFMFLFLGVCSYKCPGIICGVRNQSRICSMHKQVFQPLYSLVFNHYFEITHPIFVAVSFGNSFFSFENRFIYLSVQLLTCRKYSVLSEDCLAFFKTDTCKILKYILKYQLLWVTRVTRVTLVSHLGGLIINTLWKFICIFWFPFYH